MKFIDLTEGPNDPGIFKAVFLAGGPGSGKGYIAKQLGLQSRALKLVNSDQAYEFLMKKHGVDMSNPDEVGSEFGQELRGRAKDITGIKQKGFLDGRLGIYIDGTARDPAKIEALKTKLESIGYQTAMVFVNTSLRTAMTRNQKRARTVPIDVLTKGHKEVQSAIPHLQQLFGAMFVEIVNDDPATSNVDEHKESLKRGNKMLDALMNAPLTPKAKAWVNSAQLAKTTTEEFDVGALDVPTLSIAGVAKKHGVSVDEIKAQLRKGMQVEMEHTTSKAIAKEIALDHIAEFPDYYDRLAKAEQPVSEKFVVPGLEACTYELVYEPERGKIKKYTFKDVTGKVAKMMDEKVIQILKKKLNLDDSVGARLRRPKDEGQCTVESSINEIDTPAISPKDSKSYAKKINVSNDDDMVVAQRLIDSGLLQPEASFKGYTVYNYVKNNADQYFILADQDNKVQGFVELYRSNKGVGNLSSTSPYWKVALTMVNPVAQGKGLMLDVYKHIVTKNKITLVSDDAQSLGGRGLWERLAKTPGIFVYAWNKSENEFFQWDADVDPDEEVYGHFNFETVLVATREEGLAEAREFKDTSSPLQQLVNDYSFFASLGTVHLDKDATSPAGADKIKQVLQQLNKGAKTFQNMSGSQLEKNRDAVLRHINDMIGWFWPILKANLNDAALDKKKKQVQKLLDLYKVAAAKTEGEKLSLPDIEVGDEVKVGKFKNRKATVKGFDTDDHNQPVLKTTKGDQKLFKPRISKLEQSVKEAYLTEEQMLIEGFLDSAKQYLGNLYDTTTQEIKGTLTDLKHAGVVIKDIVSNPEYLIKVNAQLGKQINNVIKQIGTISVPTIQPVVAFIKTKIMPLISMEGIKGFLARLGLYGVLKFVVTQANNLTDIIKDQILNVMGDVVQQVSSAAASMSSFMGIFDTLQTVKKYFLDVLTYIKNKLMVKVTTEASYEGNIGMMELVKFQKVASPEEHQLLHELLKQKMNDKAWQLIQKVTGVRLQGKEFEMAESVKDRNLFWVAYAKSLKTRGIMPVEEIPDYVRRLRDAERKWRSEKKVDKPKESAYTSYLTSAELEGLMELDIPRNEMPQIRQRDLEQDYTLKHMKAHLKDLTPVQSQRVPGLVKKTAAAIDSGSSKPGPIVIDKDGHIVNGHHRYDAYKLLNMDVVPVLVVTDATIHDLKDRYSHTSSDAPVEINH